jgi:hypothetical protein
MSPPSPEEQLQFLKNLQRILSEGGFVATYKFALLMALADIAVERGDDSGARLTIPTQALAEKFVIYYWPQTSPYGSSQAVLRQNTGSKAAILLAVEDTRRTSHDSLSMAKQDAKNWGALISYVDNVIRTMPLWKLQTVESGTLECLYPNRPGERQIELLPGVAACFRQFYEIVEDLARGAWIRYIRRHNVEALGNVSDLEEFLFGSERQPLPPLVPALRDLQKDRCFYCDRELQKSIPHVDHFIPRSRYAIDLGHNFVLAHSSCNLNKSDHLAASAHLEKWVDRNASHDPALRAAGKAAGLLCDLPTSLRVARWAYARAESQGTPAWLQADTLEPLKREWGKALEELLKKLGSPAA